MRALATACVAVLAPGRLARAQQPSPMADLLARAHTALDNLQYARADSIARNVLALGTRASRAERIDALSIAAAALYPEEPRAQHRDSAATLLRLLVRLEPERNLSSAVSWRGLDSLLAQVRRETFGAIARPRPENPLLGISAAVSIPAVATRPARFHLVAVRPGGPPIPLDSSGPTTAALLHIRLFDGDQPRLPSGSYVLRFLAVDSAAPDTITLEYPARVDAPALDLLPTLDSTQLLPERTGPNRGRSIAIGIGLGGATALFASLLRGASPVRESSSVGATPYVVGAGLAVGAIIAGVTDHGAPIPANIAANARLRAGLSRARDLVAENDRRRSSYRASITVEPEPSQ